MKFATVYALNAADATVASQTSAAIDTSFWYTYSAFSVAVGGTITGTVKIQVSNDEVIGGAPVNWIDLPSATSSVTAAGNYLIGKTDIAFRWLRVVYTKASSAGGATITVIVNGLAF